MTTTTAIENARRPPTPGKSFKATDIADIALGMGATFYGYTDMAPYEVIAKTAKTVTVRAMAATLDPTWAPNMVAVGGFVAHCSNQGSQRWIMESDPTGHVETLRLTMRGWHGRSGIYGIGIAVKFHDYNF